MYDAFVSYSHAGDGRLAPELQSALEQFARPLFRRRAVHVFRDETNLSVTPHLWDTIIENLSQARWFLLLASPEVARSKWVRRGLLSWVALIPLQKRPVPVRFSSGGLEKKTHILVILFLDIRVPLL